MALAYKVSDIVISASIEPEAFGRVCCRSAVYAKTRLLQVILVVQTRQLLMKKLAIYLKLGNAKSLSKKIIKVPYN